MYQDPQFDHAQALISKLEQDLNRATARAIQAEVQAQYYEEILKANADALGLEVDENGMRPKQVPTEHVTAETTPLPAPPGQMPLDPIPVGELVDPAADLYQDDPLPDAPF